ncbi:histone deacetylase clr3 [Rhizophagus irregularis]|uniref:histone deacetylase n=1 Tax=Rhizophagus irregularis TaxID=588596 RepID=A0A2N0S7C2_9GLOM|nr:histone deacetylase clr3 [Rhizophagus irregularis]
MDMDIDGTDGKPYVLIEPRKLPVTKGSRNRVNYTNGESSNSLLNTFSEPKTGIVYDRRMRYHGNIHEDEHHPEDPKRITVIQEKIKNTGCLNKMVLIKAREVSAEEACLVHTEDHWDFVTKTAHMSDNELIKNADEYNSIYLNNETAFCARLSCGGVIELCKAVVDGTVTNGFANVRPPGHHAEINEPMGFCIFNKMAVATQCLRKHYNVEKVFILDWDIHHGNGTQKAFYNDPNVVYCSIHRYENGHFYPGDKALANYTAIGGGEAKGKTINIPWPRAGMTDSDYIFAFNKVVMPIAYEFSPDIVIVSAGFDAAEGDPIGENHVTPSGFGHMTHMLKTLANGKLILALEGGYNLDSISKSALACVKVLLGEPPSKLGPINPNQDCLETIHQVIRTQSKYWNCLAPVYYATEDRLPGQLLVDMAEMLKMYRTRNLYSKYKLIPVPLSDGKLGQRFTNLACCSGDLFRKEVVFFFVHDMADFRADTRATSNSINVSNSYMIDTVYLYIETILGNNHGIIDVDVPPVVNQPKNENQDLKDLLIFLWDNLIEATNPKKVILIGAGRGCRSLAGLINERDYSIMEKVVCTIMIPGPNEVPSVSKRTDLSTWYQSNANVLLPANHPFWEKKIKREHGTCSKIEDLNNMPVQDMLVHLHNDMFSHINQILVNGGPANSSNEERNN